MLPFCDRSVTVSRKDILPVWTRSFPISKQPETLGQHLRKKRFDSGLRQSEAAQRLNISDRTLSCWECDRIVPAWAYQPRLIAYLGYDPFTGLTPGKTKGNETPRVAFLSPDAPLSIGQKIRHFRLKSHKTLKQFASELGVSIKTLWGWETDRRQPSALCRKRIAE